MKKWIALILSMTLLLSLVGCGNAPKKATLDTKALYESYAPNLPDMFYPDEAMMMDFLGIRAEDCVQYQIAICAEGMRSDEVWLIEAKDDAALERLQQLAQNRVTAKLDETEFYAPDQFTVVKQAEVLTNGRYLALLISPEVETLKAGFEAALK